MANKTNPTKELRSEKLTMRLTKSEKSLILRLQYLLSNRSRVNLNETQTVVSSLKIAAEELGIHVTSKSST